MRNPQLQYQQQAVLNASPLRLVVKLYDLAIQASYQENDRRLREVLSTLIMGLNFDYEPADKLFALYQYCQELSRKGNYDEVRMLLEPIRDAWEETANKSVEPMVSAS
jgi:flagellin-specific chaperone FliS